MTITRRQAIKKSLLHVSAAATLDFELKKSPFKLGACDWSLGKTMDAGAFEVAKQIGLQGVQLSYNRGNDHVGLSNPTTLNVLKAAAKQSGVKISSLAIGELNNVPYKSETQTEEWVWNSVDIAHVLGVKVILLAFFGKGDLRKDEAGKKEVIKRLKKVAPHAEKKGIVLGLETYLSAEEHLDIINAVGSKSVQVYYDFRNAADAGYDIYKEIPLLGKEMICELHMKENGKRLGEGTLDWPRIAEAVKEIDYKGWMQIEWANSTPNIVACYKHNRQYLSQLFQF